MGRIGRQRKYKSVDPSHGGTQSHETESKYDLAPKDKRDDQVSVPRKMKRMMAVSKGVSGNVQTARQKQINSNRKALKKQERNRLKIKPGETRKQFFSRLDSQVGKALNNAMMKTKKLREGRKSHLKKRDEKRKMKKTGYLPINSGQGNKSRDETTEKPTEDHVRFGEVVDEPPQLSSVPRKAKIKKVVPSSMKLAAAFAEKTCDVNEDKRTDDLADSEKAKDKLILEEARNKAISEYRKLKHRKNHFKFVMP